jgi:hypothetical protein
MAEVIRAFLLDESFPVESPAIEPYTGSFNPRPLLNP